MFYCFKPSYVPGYGSALAMCGVHFSKHTLIIKIQISRDQIVRSGSEKRRQIFFSPGSASTMYTVTAD